MRLTDRITFGHVAPVVLAVVAAMLVAAVLSDRSMTTQVPIAATSIPAGAAIGTRDTRLVSVHSGDTAVRSGLLPADDLGRGWVATVEIVAGDPITRSEVARAASGPGGLGSMSIPVSMAHADGGAIVAGDLVDVIADNGANGAQYIAQGLRVLSVPSATTSTGVLASDAGSYYVVVAVDRPTALRLSAAVAGTGGPGSSSGIDVVRTTGEAPTATGDGA
jgi:Flp pilus assembly protein CpaB